MQRETGVVYGYTENSSKSSQRNPKRTEAGAGATSRNSTSVPVVVVYKYSPISHVPKSRDYARRLPRQNTQISQKGDNSR